MSALPEDLRADLTHWLTMAADAAQKAHEAFQRGDLVTAEAHYHAAAAYCATAARKSAEVEPLTAEASSPVASRAPSADRGGPHPPTVPTSEGGA